MTNLRDGVRILGPLEAQLGAERLPLGGSKQRATLALLLLHADEIVSVDRLVDEVWGDNPPPSATHSIEAYLSRLRQPLERLGLRLLRRGTGYVLELGGVALDARTFGELHDKASRAAARGDDERASALAAEALSLWRGEVLADVTLGAWGKVEAERLEERRLLVAEQRADAELRLGRHEDLAGELQALVRHHPYRERLVVLLMLALYRCGRHADALDAYEQTRARLARDLGLQPSAELQQLSGQIVRHAPELRNEARSGGAAVLLPRRTFRRSVLLAGALAASAVVLAASGSVRQVAGAAPAAKSTRVALVLPRAPARGTRDPIAGYATRLRDFLYFDDTLTAQTIVADDVDEVSSTLARGGFDLVLWVGGGSVARAFAPRVHDLARTRFVFLDASLETLGLEGVPNATAARFAEEQSAELVGYMSGLVDVRGSSKRADVVSVIAEGPSRAGSRIVAGFRRGVTRARPSIRVRVAYVPERAARTRCEQLANAQIDRGSDVLFVAAGRCGVAASAVARVRNVWVVDGDGAAGDGEHVLVRAYKERNRAFDAATIRFQNGTLPAGRDIVLGLVDDYAVGLWRTSTEVPASISSAVVRLCSSIREHAERDTS